MDEIGRWNSYIQSQLPGMRSTEHELMLTLSIPLEANSREFRIGWDLKGMRTGRWLAMTTGRAVWNRFDVVPAAQFVVDLLEECNRLLEPIDPADKR